MVTVCPRSRRIRAQRRAVMRFPRRDRGGTGVTRHILTEKSLQRASVPPESVTLPAGLSKANLPTILQVRAAGASRRTSSTRQTLPDRPCLHFRTHIEDRRLMTPFRTCNVRTLRLIPGISGANGRPIMLYSAIGLSFVRGTYVRTKRLAGSRGVPPRCRVGGCRANGE